MSENVTGAATKLFVLGREVEFHPLRDLDIQGIENDERYRHIHTALLAARDLALNSDELAQVSKGAVEACLDFDFLGPWGKKQFSKPQYQAKVVVACSRGAITADEAIQIVKTDPTNLDLVLYVAFGRLFGMKKPEVEVKGEQRPTAESQSTPS